MKSPYPGSEMIEFNDDMTYKSTDFVFNTAFLKVGENPSITGSWDIEDDQVTFLTAKIHMDTTKQDVPIYYFDGTSIVPFVGVQ
jgi:hypothetical protein